MSYVHSIELFSIIVPMVSENSNQSEIVFFVS